MGVYQYTQANATSKRDLDTPIFVLSTQSLSQLFPITIKVHLDVDGFQIKEFGINYTERQFKFWFDGLHMNFKSFITMDSNKIKCYQCTLLTLSSVYQLSSDRFLCFAFVDCFRGDEFSVFSFYSSSFSTKPMSKRNTQQIKK